MPYDLSQLKISEYLKLILTDEQNNNTRLFKVVTRAIG